MTDRQPAGSSRARTGADAHRTTTDRDTTDTRPMTDTTDTTETDAQPGTRQKMKEMDHTPPVEGARRTFERRDEGRPARTDGGNRDEHEGTADEDDDDATPDGGFSQKMKEMDHTPPVDGANRTFERGKDDDDDDDDVAE